MSYAEQIDQWLKSNSNKMEIKLVYIDEDSTAHFTFDDINFNVTYPKFKLNSSDDWFDDEMKESVLNAETISNALDIITNCLYDDDEDDHVVVDDDTMYQKEEVIEKVIDEDEEKVEKLMSKFELPKDYEMGAIKTISREFTEIKKEKREDRGFSVRIVNDMITRWGVKYYNVPHDTMLWKDMEKMGFDHILMEILFPTNYPFAPPYIRVIKPRFEFRKGHVTIGGSICIDTLTNQGWSSTYKISQVLLAIVSNMIAGDARLDFNNKNEYTEYEAKEAFHRLLGVHGWTHWNS